MGGEAARVGGATTAVVAIGKGVDGSLAAAEVTAVGVALSAPVAVGGAVSTGVAGRVVEGVTVVGRPASTLTFSVVTDAPELPAARDRTAPRSAASAITVNTTTPNRRRSARVRGRK